VDSQQANKKSLQIIHMSLATLWIYQGLVPKILFQANDEIQIWRMQGFNPNTAIHLMQYSGVMEILFGCLFLCGYKSRLLHRLNILGMLGLSFLILGIYPQYFMQAFNPFVMNVAMAALSLTALTLIQQRDSSSHMPRPH
jgi:uncharacterized membrane protein YphA (DoxX/SURF4 family)